MTSEKYPHVFRPARRSPYRSRVGQRCRVMGYRGPLKRRVTIEFEDGVQIEVHVAAISPFPEEARIAALDYLAAHDTTRPDAAVERRAAMRVIRSTEEGSDDGH